MKLGLKVFRLRVHLRSDEQNMSVRLGSQDFASLDHLISAGRFTKSILASDVATLPNLEARDAKV